MNTKTINAIREDIFSMIRQVDDIVVLDEIKNYLKGVNSLSPEIPFFYSKDTLHQVVEMSEEAIDREEIYTNEQVRAIHPKK